MHTLLVCCPKRRPYPTMLLNSMRSIKHNNNDPGSCCAGPYILMLRQGGRASTLYDVLSLWSGTATASSLTGHSNANTTAQYDQSGERAKQDGVRLLHVAVSKARAIENRLSVALRTADSGDHADEDEARAGRQLRHRAPLPGHTRPPAPASSPAPRPRPPPSHDRRATADVQFRATPALLRRKTLLLCFVWYGERCGQQKR